MIVAIEILMVVAAAGFVVFPLVYGSRTTGEIDEEEQELLSRKERVYTAIKDLDFDYQTGKLTDDDYVALKDKFKEEAVALLKQGETGAYETGLDDEIEREIEARRKAGTKRAAKGGTGLRCSKCHEPYSAGDKFCHKCGSSLGLQCSNCGSPHGKGDKFCQNCGNKL